MLTLLSTAVLMSVTSVGMTEARQGLCKQLGQRETPLTGRLSLDILVTAVSLGPATSLPALVAESHCPLQAPPHVSLHPLKAVMAQRRKGGVVYPGPSRGRWVSWEGDRAQGPQ